MTGRGWLLLSLALLAAPLRAQEPPSEPWFEEVAKVGFGDDLLAIGAYKLGKWTPVEVTLVGGPRMTQGLVTLHVLDGDGVPTEVAATKPIVQVQAGQHVRVRFIARIGSTEERLRASYHWEDAAGNEGVAARAFEDRSQAMAYGRQLIVTVGRPTGIAAAIKKRSQYWRTDADPQVVALPDASTLPTRWYGYEAIDLLVLATSQPLIYQEMSDSQRQAIDQWVRQGGKLLLCVGQSFELVQPNGPLAAFAPGEFDTLHQLTLGRGFERFVDNPQPLFTKPDLRIPVAKFNNINPAQILANEADLPLVVRKPHGFGEVLFVAADLDQPLFHNWGSGDRFYQRLLDWPAAELSEEEQQQWSHYGVTDLASQLRGALDQFEGVTLVPFGVVAVLVVGYILLIGPLDYLFVKRVLKRMELTWVTFPLTVIGVSLLAYFLAGWLKGDKLRINQASVVDVDVEDLSVRGTSWLNVFSPQTTRYNLDVQPTLPVESSAGQAATLLAWMGLPEDAIGGMNRHSSWGSSGNGYLLDLESGKLANVPIQVWSTKTFTARWSVSGVELLEADLRADGEDLDSAQLISHMNIPLEQCLLTYGGSVYDIGRLKPGQTMDVSLVQRMSFKDRLKDTVLVQGAKGSPYQPTPYNVGSHDAHEILKLMMFYTAADGPEYTQLRNSNQSYLDLSSHLDAGKAILIARVEKPAVSLRKDGTPLATHDVKNWTWYRFVLPVQQVQK